MKQSRIIFGVLRLPLDFIFTFSAFLLAYRLRPVTDLIPGVHYQFERGLLPEWRSYLTFSLIATTALIFFFVFGGLYSLKKREGSGKTFFKVTFLISSWLLFIIAYYFLIVHQLFFSRIALAHIWFFSIIFITTERFILNRIQLFLLHFGIGQRRVLFVGANDLTDQCHQQLKKDRRYKIIGALAEERYSRKKDTIKIIGTFEQLESIVKKHCVEEIIQADDTKAGDLLGFCRSWQIKYYFIPDLLRLQRTSVEMEIVDDIPLISLKQTPLEGWGAVWKRIFDFLFSLILSILLIPLWIIVALLIKIDSRGPVFYASKRKYKRKIFNVYKFRSMKMDADKEKDKLLNKNERKGPLFKIKNDPRITKMGHFLRKTSIDELPQLFNVLIGNMSLVGPRPHLPEEVEQYESHHYEVFAIKPGLTGLAQISGRSNLDFEEEVKLDVYYIENWSVWMDIKIILKSAGIVFRADGC